MKKHNGLRPWSLTTLVVLLIAGGGIWILMYIASGMGLAAAGGGGGTPGYHVETRKNYSFQSTLKAPTGYSFVGNRNLPLFADKGDTIGLLMHRDELKTRTIDSLAIYDYLTGDHIYTYDYPEDPRRKRKRLTQDAIYNLYVRHTDNEGERISKIQDARVCWDKHNIITEETTTLCYDKPLTGGGRNYISPDGKYIIINGRDLVEGRGYERYIISSETGELIKKISLGDGTLKPTYGGKLLHSYKGNNGFGDNRRDWYILDLSQLRLVKTNETKPVSGKTSVFKTKIKGTEYYSYRDFPHNYNPACATKYNGGIEKVKAVICKTSFAPD